LFQDNHASIGCVVLDGDDHGVLGADGYFRRGYRLGGESGGDEGEGRRSKTGSEGHAAGSRRYGWMGW
jgi:hypothetical protein